MGQFQEQMAGLLVAIWLQSLACIGYLFGNISSKPPSTTIQPLRCRLINGCFPLTVPHSPTSSATPLTTLLSCNPQLVAPLQGRVYFVAGMRTASLQKPCLLPFCTCTRCWRKEWRKSQVVKNYKIATAPKWKHWKRLLFVFKIFKNFGFVF